MNKILIIKRNNFKISGFTLIELLVVISIIGILAGLLIANMAGIRERARDVQRKSDLDQIKKALRMYYNDHNIYPTSLPSPGEELKDETSGMVYMKYVPGDPSTNEGYSYSIGSCIDDFRLRATLENKSDPAITSSQTRCKPSCGVSSYATDEYVVCAD